MADTGQSARKILQKIELIAVVDSEIRINLPDEYSINFPQPLLGLIQKTVDCVFVFFRVVQASIPDQNLHLQEDMLRPFQIGPLVLGAVISKSHPPISTPRLEPVKPPASLRGTIG